jgi:hypothetical protein
MNNCLWKLPNLIMRTLKLLSLDGEMPLRQTLLDESKRSPGEGPGRAKQTRSVGGSVLSWSGRYLGVKYHETFYRNQWCLAYHFDLPDGAESETPELDASRYRPLLLPGDCDWADPFPVRHEDRFYVFFEEYGVGAPRAHICVVELDRSGAKDAPTRILERPYHLSFPFVFEYQGDHFMIPETWDNRTIEVYRARDFPYDWAFDRVLMSGVRAVDTTVVEAWGRWWMLTTLGTEGVLPYDELHVFHADTPFGPWNAHARNPVVSDVRNSRSAGRLFWRDKELHRPAQDCSLRYGYATNVNRVDQLTASTFEETIIARIQPNWAPGLVATHTMNAAGPLSVIDFQRRVRRRWRR